MNIYHHSPPRPQNCFSIPWQPNISLILRDGHIFMSKQLQEERTVRPMKCQTQFQSTIQIVMILYYASKTRCLVQVISC